MKKAIKVKRDFLAILRAALIALKEGLIKPRESGGYCPTELANMISASKRDVIRAVKACLNKNIARFNNRLVHMDVNKLSKFVAA